jgi:hypothetical protein
MNYCITYFPLLTALRRSPNNDAVNLSLRTADHITLELCPSVKAATWCIVSGVSCIAFRNQTILLGPTKCSLQSKSSTRDTGLTAHAGSGAKIQCIATSSQTPTNVLRHISNGRKYKHNLKHILLPFSKFNGKNNEQQWRQLP